MNPSDNEMQDLARRLGTCLVSKGLKMSSAESCTGGWLAKIVTDIPGSSSWFGSSVVCYSNESKHALLGVNESTLLKFGAVSRETVIELADGLFQQTDADVVASISGIAGPDGGSDDKPVGLVWFSWGMRGQDVLTASFNFDGDREAVRRQAVEQVFNCLLDMLDCP